MPSEYHWGAVAKSDSALLPITAAHQRDRASPVLSPQRLPFMEHSLRSAPKRADTRAEFPDAAPTSMAFPAVQSQRLWSAPPVPPVAPPRAKTITLTGPPVVPKIPSLALTTRSASLSKS